MPGGGSDADRRGPGGGPGAGPAGPGTPPGGARERHVGGVVRAWCQGPCAASRTCSWCVAVRPAVRSRPAVSEAFPWVLRGSAHCTGPSGLGDTAASFPAGGGPVREVNDTSRTVRRRPRRRSFAAAARFREARENTGGHPGTIAERSGAKGDFRCGECLVGRFQPAPRMAGCHRSSEVGSSVSRTSRRPPEDCPSTARERSGVARARLERGRISAGGFRSYGEGNAPGAYVSWWPRDLAVAERGVPPSKGRPLSGGWVHARGRPGLPPGFGPGPAFARGACPSDVRRP